MYLNKELKILNIHAPLFWRQKMVEDGSCLDQWSPTKEKLSLWISLPKLPYSPSINLPHSLHSWWISRPINEKLCINLMIIDDNFSPVNIYPRIPRVYSLLIPIIAFHIITNLIKFMWVLMHCISIIGEISIGQISCYKVYPSNLYIIPWMLHQIFM